MHGDQIGEKSGKCEQIQKEGGLVLNTVLKNKEIEYGDEHISDKGILRKVKQRTEKLTAFKQKK